MRIKKLVLLPLAIVALAVGALAVATASGTTTPKWYVGGTELSGSETLGGLAEPSNLTVAGVSTKCEHSYYVAKILNSGGLGKGEVTYLPLYGCSASGGGCTLAKIEPTKLPWPMHTVFVGTTPYLVIEGVHILTAYEGASCALKGTSEAIGSLGGKIENSTQKTVFNSASASATGTSLKVGTTSVGFEGSYSEEAAGPEHKGQLVEAK